jgi:hypothetical protein
VKEVCEELRGSREVEMHVDGLLKFGDYTPFCMRMIQVEAVGNFLGREFETKRSIDGGDGLRKLYPPTSGGAPVEEAGVVYARTAPPSAHLDAYRNLHALRERLCRRLSSDAARASCADHSLWKPHISAAYVNEGSEAITEAMVLDFQQQLLQRGLVGPQAAASISYWEMRGKIASEWVERSRVALPSLEVKVLDRA